VLKHYEITMTSLKWRHNWFF